MSPFYVGVVMFLVSGVTYEFQLSASNQVDFGLAAVQTLATPDGSE